MKNIRLLMSVMFLVAVCLSGTTFADRNRSHVRVGFYVGAPYLHWYYPPVYYYPYPYYSPAEVTQPQSQIYIEQDAYQAGPQQASEPQRYWYHCDKPEGYYPYIQACPGGWQAVVPTPPQPQ